MHMIRVDGRVIGEGQPCYIAAEIGINHNGDMNLAHGMIDAAADSGADAVKFQNYKSEDFVSDRTLMYEYMSQGRTLTESQYDMFKRCEVSREALAELRRHCAARRVTFFSTPTGEDGLNDLVHAGAALVKNGSDYLVNLSLIAAMARTGLPTVLSTGMATLAEIDDAVTAFRQAGGRELVLLHCTSSYPTPPADVHLRKIPALASVFGCPVGLSDHTRGWVAAAGAVVVGACFIEKHFTLDKALPGPDHNFSADPLEFSNLVDAVRTVEKNLGEAMIGPASSELTGRRDFRLSCVAARDLPHGHCLTEGDVAFRRPGSGLPPKAAQELVGRPLSRAVAAGEAFHSGDFVRI